VFLICEGKFCKNHNIVGSFTEWYKLRITISDKDRYRKSILSKDCPALQKNIVGRKIILESENLMVVEEE
jgi:hypothetical protein